MIIGTAYYPEHWSRERWETDCRLMRDMGINTVRMGEFGWSVMEREEGKYDFSLYDEAIDLMGRYGISVILGTPTATPPAWLCQKYPDIYMKDRQGLVRGFGSRRHYCYNHKGYRAASSAVVLAMARHYRDNPHVIAWQIDNELGCEDEVRCYCEDCKKEFARWLEKKYGTLDKVNKAWGTVFWSQTYTEWGQIPLPAQTVVDSYTGYGHNPGMLLDFARFSSDSLIDYAAMQCRILKAEASQPVVHNMVSEYCDNYRLVKLLDGAGYDAYPRSEWDHNSPERIGFYYDLTRGYNEKVPFWILEQQSGPCGWNVVGDTPAEGQLRLWSLQGAARGAEALVYFRWRSCLFGAEQFWYGILDHDGIPRRRYEELRKTAVDLRRFEPVFRLSGQKQVLLVYDYDNKFSHEFQPHIRGFSYKEEIVRYYEGLQRLHIPVDIEGVDSDFSKYKMVIFPFASIASEKTVERLEEYTASGGILVLTPFTGMRTEDNQITDKTLPGVFRRLSGLEVEEFVCKEGCEEVCSSGNEPEPWGKACGWREILKPVEAEAAAEYKELSHSGKRRRTAAARNQFGEGCVYYIGSLYDSYEMLLGKIAQREQIESYGLPQDVECIAKEDGNYLILLNHSSELQKIEMAGYCSLDGKELPLMLEGCGVEILKRQNN